MNHKYIDIKTFDIIDDVFEVDEYIAEAISILNKKGYYTKYCCSGHTFDDGRYITFTFDVPYYDGYLSEAFLDDSIKLDDFINKLEFVSALNDGGSKLYMYNKVNEMFGDEDFYTLVCNSYAGIKDIFVAKNIDSLTDKCIIKIDDLDGVAMSI